MNQTIVTSEASLDTALEAALDATAPTTELWQAGHAAFYETLSTKHNIEVACYAALDAAAPDEETWTSGRNILVLNGVLALPETERPSLMERSKSMFTTGPSHWSTQVVPVRAFRLLFLGLGVLIFMGIQPAMFGMYKSTYGVGAGTFASLVVFALIGVAAAVIGDLALRWVRKSNHTTPSTTS